jgi:hypothetical protein
MWRDESGRFLARRRVGTCHGRHVHSTERVLPVADDGARRAGGELLHEPVREPAALLVPGLLHLADLDPCAVLDVGRGDLQVPRAGAGDARGLARLPLEGGEEEAVPCLGRRAELGGKDGGLEGVDVRGVDDDVHGLAGDEARQVVGDGVQRLGTLGGGLSRSAVVPSLLCKDASGVFLCAGRGEERCCDLRIYMSRRELGLPAVCVVSEGTPGIGLKLCRPIERPRRLHPLRAAPPNLHRLPSPTSSSSKRSPSSSSVFPPTPFPPTPPAHRLAAHDGMLSFQSTYAQVLCVGAVFAIGLLRQSS